MGSFISGIERSFHDITCNIIKIWIHKQEFSSQIFHSVYEKNQIFSENYLIRIPGFPGGAAVKNPPASAEDTGLCPGPGRSHMPQSN